jgi:hypothetical protein
LRIGRSAGRIAIADWQCEPLALAKSEYAAVAKCVALAEPVAFTESVAFTHIPA